MTFRILHHANAGGLASAPLETMNNNSQFTMGQEHYVHPMGSPDTA